jgi:hypothetical protein
MTSSFIPCMGRLPHAVRKMHRPSPPHSCTLKLNDPARSLYPSSHPPTPRLLIYFRSEPGNDVLCLYSRFDCHILGSDGTVSIWDKDARTRMKSKPVHLLFLSFSSLFPGHTPRLASACVLVRPVARHQSFRSVVYLSTGHATSSNVHLY